MTWTDERNFLKSRKINNTRISSFTISSEEDFFSDLSSWRNCVGKWKQCRCSLYFARFACVKPYNRYRKPYDLQSKLHKPLGECNLRTFKTLRVPINQELYKKVVRFFIYSILNKITINQSERQALKLISVYFRNLLADVGNLQKTLVEPRTTFKFFGSTPEIFGSTSATFGSLRANFRNLSVNFRNLRANFGNLRKTSGKLQKSSGPLGMYSEDFGKLRVNFGKKSNWYPWEYNLGLNNLITLFVRALL